MKSTELPGLASSKLQEDGALLTTLSTFCSTGLGQIWSWCSRKHGAPRKLRSFGALDVEGELDATSYREKVTRWKRESLSAISHPAWQKMVGVSYNVREPLRHFRRFLMEVPRDSCKVGKVARLVSCLMRVRGPSRCVCCHLRILLQKVASLQQRCQLRQESCSDDPSISDALALACESTHLDAMLSASSSRRRTHQYKPRVVGDTALKIRILFHDQLVSTQSTGSVSVELFALFFQVACHLHAGRREIEAVNNVIKHQVERAGFRGSLNLVSDRVLNTKAVHLGESSTPEWSELEPHVSHAWVSQSRGSL